MSGLNPGAGASDASLHAPHAALGTTLSAARAAPAHTPLHFVPPAPPPTGLAASNTRWSLDAIEALFALSLPELL